MAAWVREAKSGVKYLSGRLSEPQVQASDAGSNASSRRCRRTILIQEVLNHFDGVRETGSGQYSCRCPAHEDKSASLGIKQGDGGQDTSKLLCWL